MKAKILCLLLNLTTGTTNLNDYNSISFEDIDALSKFDIEEDILRAELEYEDEDHEQYLVEQIGERDVVDDEGNDLIQLRAGGSSSKKIIPLKFDPKDIKPESPWEVILDDTGTLDSLQIANLGARQEQLEKEFNRVV